MTDAENLRDRWEQLLRYRAMQRESTDPLAIGLLRDIVLELQTGLQAADAGEPTGPVRSGVAPGPD